jgi:TPP-dependent 2-oxoacid decarboxylase
LFGPAAVDEVLAMMKQAKRPIIISDAEMIRYHLQDKLRALVERTQIPYATMMMGKAIIDETNPLFVGQYMGNNSRGMLFCNLDMA